MSTKIMIQFHKKYNKTTKNDFDHAIAELFDSASATVNNKLANAGKNPSYEFDFWRDPKLGTVFENVSDKTTYRFAVKLLEARKRWIERQPVEQESSHDAARFECKAAKAIDRFNGIVEVAALASSGVTALMNGVFTETVDFAMNSYMIDQFNQFSDTEEDSSDDEGPNQPRAAKRGMIEQTGTPDGDIEAPTAKRVKVQKTGTADGDVGFDPALVAGTARLAIGGGAPEVSNGAKEDNMNGTGDFGAFLAQLAKEDEAQLDEEDMMEMDGY